LILRFYDVDQGCVLVDGVDVREMRQQDFGKNRFVPQTPELFNGTVADNIRYGKSGAATKRSDARPDCPGR
jgi:ATP-binding cassette subfamily B protein